MTRSSAVILDTDVFSLLFISPRTKADREYTRVDKWRRSLSGHRVVISFQTRAEVLAGAYEAKWGASRISNALDILDRTPTIDSSNDVVKNFARLRAAAKAVGHPIAQNVHTGDCWIAACAITVGLPLLTGNEKHFKGAPELMLLPQ